MNNPTIGTYRAVSPTCTDLGVCRHNDGPKCVDRCRLYEPVPEDDDDFLCEKKLVAAIFLVFTLGVYGTVLGSLIWLACAEQLTSLFWLFASLKS